MEWASQGKGLYSSPLIKQRDLCHDAAEHFGASELLLYLLGQQFRAISACGKLMAGIDIALCTLLQYCLEILGKAHAAVTAWLLLLVLVTVCHFDSGDLHRQSAAWQKLGTALSAARPCCCSTK